MKWLREYGFTRHPGGCWVKVACAGCSAVLRRPDELGWDCVITYELELADSKATYLGLKSCGCGLSPFYALAMAMRGLYDIQDTLADVDLDGALIKLGNPKGK